MFAALQSVLWEKAEDKLFDDKKKKDDEEAGPKVEIVVSDAEVLAAGRKTRIGLVAISLAMLAFCVGMMGYFAYELGVVVGGPCDGSQDRYHNYEHCWNLKENWCANAQCSAGGEAMGNSIDISTRTAADGCPTGCSVCSGSGGSGPDPVELWLEQLARFDRCRKNTEKVRECLPTMDHDGSLANYRGYKTAHPSSGMGASESFIQRDAFLDACDAQAVYADRREKGGSAVVACIAVCALVWLGLTLYLMRTPNYEKYPRETEYPDLAKWQDRKDYVHRFHPRSAWLYYSTASNLFGFALQLYSFYTPTSTNILTPIFQGAWMTIMVVTRGVLVLMDQYTMSEASSVFFDIGFGIIGFTAILEPFFEPTITTDLPVADESITDYALAVRVAAFLWPLVSSASSIRDLYCDNYWPSPATTKAIKEKQKSVQKRAVKIVVFATQLLAALSVYVVMANPKWCHDFRTCQRKTTCDPLEGGILSRMVFDTNILSSNDAGGNKMQRVELISDDGTEKWRWQINTQTQMSFTKSGGKVYADLTFQVPNGAIENSVTEPGAGAGNGGGDIVGVTPSAPCATRFEIQCHEANPRHAFKSETNSWDWVAYNSSMYKFVARHEAGETSGESSCFGADSEWWTEKAMFTAGPGLKVGDGDGEDKVGFVFMENECNTGQNDEPAGCNQAAAECRTKNCLVEPAYVASYAPYGRATVTGTWQYTTGQAAPTTFATTQHIFELDISQFELDNAAAGGGGGGGGGGNNPNNPNDPPPANAGCPSDCTPKPAGCTGNVCAGTCGEIGINRPCCC